jgi:hypothetical protein
MVPLPSSPRLASLLLLWGCCFALSGACQDQPALKLCGEIPEGGCPLGRGGTCEDALCEGLYDCVDGAWTRAEECKGRGGGGAGGGATRGSGGGGEGGAGGCDEVAIDHTTETTGCTPDLQHPDCPAVAAEGCAASVCLTGCEDFFLCEIDGWSAVAYCDEDGQIVITQ